MLDALKIRSRASQAGLGNVAFNLPLDEILSSVSVFVTIQIAVYVLMFWVRKRFRRTRDPRFAIGLFGSYCLVMGTAALYCGTKLKLVGVRKSKYATFAAVVMLATVVVLVISPKWRGNE